MDILGDRKFVEVPGTATHELPPLLVHMSPDVKRLDRVMGMANELIEQEDDTPSIFTEFLAANGPGYHQLAYWAADFDATMTAVEDAGWPVVWSGGEGFGVRFAYVEPPNSPAYISQIVEISELTDATLASSAFIREAAASWDGSDPIRELGG